MKKLHEFSKAFLGCAIFSAVVIATGIAGFFVKGINWGLDFQPGLIEEVRIASPAMSLSYSGSAKVDAELSATGFDLVITGVGEKETKSFAFGQYSTVSALADALKSVEGITAEVLSSGDADCYSIFTNSAVSAVLGKEPFFLYVPDAKSSVTVEDLRTAVTSEAVQVKELGSEADRSFQVRAKIKGDQVSSQELQRKITGDIQNKFGKNNVAIVRTDFVGSTFSSDLAYKSILLAVATLFLIWLYATIRFHWDFALGAIIALVHDCLILFTFIIWFQLEFTTTTLAAVLTIFGYSINATVVILDRVRENMKSMEAKEFNSILNRSLSDTLT
ncbi:MAG: protein translocase subunit SecF, partial [Treponema sp.]|nr:protein translocase subunit SecF [Treponema sp.]